MEKKEYITPDSICLEPSAESPFMNEIISQGEDNGEVEAKKLTDKLFDDEEEL